MSGKKHKLNTTPDDIITSMTDMFADLSQDVTDLLSRNKAIATTSSSEFVGFRSMVEEKFDKVISLLQQLCDAPNARNAVRNNSMSDSLNEPAATNQASFNSHLEKIKELSDLRKDIFYSHLRHAGIREAYSKCLKADPPKVPHKMRVKVTNRDSPAIIECKKKHCVQKTMTEIEKLGILEGHDKKNMEDIEEEVNHIIASAPQFSEDLIRMWSEMKADEEARSHEIWAKRGEFFVSEPK